MWNMLGNSPIKSNNARKIKCKECGVVTSGRSACGMLENHFGKIWKEDMQTLRRKEEVEDSDMDMEAIPSVRNRKLGMTSTTGKGMQKSDD